MSEGTKLEFCDATHNLVGGCYFASPGCENCYAALSAATFHQAAGIYRRVRALHRDVTNWFRGKARFNGELTVAKPNDPAWGWARKWKGAEHPKMGDGQPSIIFVSDMADLYHEKRATTIIDEVVHTYAACDHQILFLTKRPAVMADYFLQPRSEETLRRWKRKFWLGISTENQVWFDRRWPPMKRLAEAGWTTFICTGPQIGRIVLPDDFRALGKWVICSGEQGKYARPMEEEWAHALLDQCRQAEIPFFLNQMSGRKDIPKELFVRDFPKVRS